MENLKELSFSKTIRIEAGDVLVHQIPYPEGLNWNNCRVIPVTKGNDSVSIPPVFKLSNDGTKIIIFKRTAWFDILIYFFRII